MGLVDMTWSEYGMVLDLGKNWKPMKMYRVHGTLWELIKIILKLSPAGIYLFSNRYSMEFKPQSWSCGFRYKVKVRNIFKNNKLKFNVTKNSEAWKMLALYFLLAGKISLNWFPKEFREKERCSQLSWKDHLACLKCVMCYFKLQTLLSDREEGIWGKEPNSKGVLSNFTFQFCSN